MNSSNQNQHHINRHRLYQKLAQGSSVIITSNDVMPSNSDGTMGFRQNNDLYWLCGINQEETILFLFPGHPDATKQEVLFVKYVDEHFIKWHGSRLSLEEASNLSGIKNVMWTHEFEQFLNSNAYLTETFYLQTTEHPRSENKTQTANNRLIDQLKQHYPLHRFSRLTPLMNTLRLVKSAEEIALLQTACDITEKGFRRVLGFVKPGVREKQIVAEMIHEYLQYNGNWSGYDPIVASGSDSCILHYTSNHKTCNSGDLLLIDAAASYNLYNADLTRAIPVNGKYTARQKAIYEAVLKVHKALAAYVKPGMYIKDIQNHCNELLAEQYVHLNLCSMKDLQKNGINFYTQQYSYHGFGHYIGLDVHDIGNVYDPVPENAVITIEPGIYSQQDGIGVRIENNIVVKATTNIDLMKNIPVETDEIESLMNG